MNELLLCVGLMVTRHCPQMDVIGDWKYTSYTYEGQTVSIPHPELDLHFTFTKDGISRLSWHPADDGSICERTALFEVRADNELYQKITWVNPNNDPSCAIDPDMQMGKESVTHYRIEPGKLMFDLELGGKPFIYNLVKSVSQDSSEALEQ